MARLRRGISTRRLVLILGLLAVVGVGGYLAYRSPWLRARLARDSENAAEIAKLSEKKLEVQPAADPATGSPGWRGATHDGRAPVGPFRTDWEKNPLNLVWKFDCGGGYSSCAVVGGKVYTQDYKDGNERVICVDGTTAPPKLLWEYSYGVDYKKIRGGYAGGPRATPSVDGNRVYAVGALGKFVCLDAVKGTPIWEHDLIADFNASVPQWGVACSPLVEGDLVIVQPGGSGGSVVAFDKNSGEVRWTAGKNPSGYSSPVGAAVGGQRVIFALTADALLAIRTADGKVTDSYSWKTEFGGNVATPLVVDDYVFISAAYGMGCALLRAEAKSDEVKLVEVYTRRGRGLQNHHCTSVFKDRFLYGFDGMNGARLKCIDFDTGKEKPDWDASGVGKGSILLADRHLIIQTERGELCLIEATPEEFRLVAKIPKVLTGNNNWATPTLVDGRLYLRDDEKIVCYDVRPQ